MKDAGQALDAETVENSDSIRVLHVDDEPDFADMAATFLKRADDQLNLQTANSASEGLRYLADTSFDCVISDHDMPGQNGIDFFEILREEYPDLPFILFTGKGSEEIASDAISAGATDYLQKETGTDQYTVLANRIGTVVEKRRVQRSRKRQLKAIETADEGIAIFDSEGCCRYANQQYIDIYGFDPAEIQDKHWKDFYPPEEVLYSYEEVMSIVDNEGYWRGKMTSVDADGDNFNTDHTISATDDGGFVCTIRLLSEQDEVEQQLFQFETVVQTLPDPVYVCDEEGRFRYVNDAFIELVGYDREEIIGSHTRLIKNEYWRAEAERNLGNILSSDGPESVTFEVEIQPKDGEPIPCEDHMSVIPYNGPRFRRSFGVLRDVSASKQRGYASKHRTVD